MNSRLFLKLAVTNIRNHAQTYYPYVLASSAAVMMFYDMLYLYFSREIGGMADSSALRLMLAFGCIVIGVFSFILLLYVNSFLIKRRKKEFGLFNVLGMEKKHIARIMLTETLMVAALCIGLGLVAGILFSKLAMLLLLNILGLGASFGFEVPLPAVAITVILFGALFLINLLYNVVQVRISRPAELLKGGNVGEKEPRTKWLMALSGAAALGAGYYIALTTESPLMALNQFFIAVLLVMVGTYGLFTAGSIAILKSLRKNKRFYYRTNPFIAISGMIYRMKRNAAGLASICILSAAVIITLSSTVSLYAGLEDVLRTRYVREIAVYASEVSDENIQHLEQIVAEETKRAGIVPQNPVSLRSASLIAMQEGNVFRGARTNFRAQNAAMLLFMTASEYSRFEGVRADLAEGEALVYAMKGEIPGDTLDLDGFALRIRSRLDKMESFAPIFAKGIMTKTYVVITADERDIFRARQALEGADAPKLLNYEYHFDTQADRGTQVELAASLKQAIKGASIDGHADGREAARQSFMAIYGILFFLGLFLGTLFLLGTVLIIYYKQISEGYDDKDRFAIMQKVGLTRDEIKKAIRFQVLAVFFLPLVTAVCHIAAAFPVITKLLALFNMTNVPLFALCTALTIVAFAVCYTLIYALTARTYYRIVR